MRLFRASRTDLRVTRHETRLPLRRVNGRLLILLRLFISRRTKRADDGIPVVSHVGLIPPKATWKGGFEALGKTTTSTMQVMEAVKKLAEDVALSAGHSPQITQSKDAFTCARLPLNTGLVINSIGVSGTPFRSKSTSASAARWPISRCGT